MRSKDTFSTAFLLHVIRLSVYIFQPDTVKNNMVNILVIFLNIILISLIKIKFIAKNSSCLDELQYTVFIALYRLIIPLQG